MKVFFSEDDIKKIDHLSKKITGYSCKERQSLISIKIVERITALNLQSLHQYLELILEDQEEFNLLISNLTIHTTSWFREKIHFTKVTEYIHSLLQSGKGLDLKIWCAACSTGEECYSFAMALEKIREKFPALNYTVLGTDIDPISVRAAVNAKYKISNFSSFMGNYGDYILEGGNGKNGFFNPVKEIRAKTRFLVVNLAQFNPEDQIFDIVICRNLLLYFDQEAGRSILNAMVKSLKSSGIFISGLSEPVQHKELRSLGHCIYQKTDFIRKDGFKILFSDGFQMNDGLLRSMEALRVKYVIARSPEDLGKLMISYNFSMICCDQSWMSQNQSATKHVAQHAVLSDIPVIVFFDSREKSSTSSLKESNYLYSTEYINKEKLKTNPLFFKKLLTEFISRKKQTGKKSPVFLAQKKPGKQKRRFLPDVIVIGASTGGTIALMHLLHNIGQSDPPPILVAQHISLYFAKDFARRLAKHSSLNLARMDYGMPLQRGFIYMAQNDHHIGVINIKGKLCLNLSNTVSSTHWPSINHLFRQAAESEKKVMAILLTGMGDDGARSMKQIRASGGYTLVQNKESCAVFGIPSAAIKLKACDFVGDISHLRNEILQCVGGKFRSG